LTALPLPSMTAGAQYAERFAMPPRHVELPLFLIDDCVEEAFVPVLPKNE
jgi:hypothetical protein